MTQRKKIKYQTFGIHLVVFMFIMLPMITFAQGSGTNTSSAPQCTELFGGNIDNLKDILDYAICLLTKSVVPLLFAIAIAVFIYGVIQYFINPNNIGERDKAKGYILWALVGLFVLVSMSGIVNILRNTFGITGNAIPLLPETQ